MRNLYSSKTFSKLLTQPVHVLFSAITKPYSQLISGLTIEVSSLLFTECVKSVLKAQENVCRFNNLNMLVLYFRKQLHYCACLAVTQSNAFIANSITKERGSNLL